MSQLKNKAYRQVHKENFQAALNLAYSGPNLKAEGMGSQGRCTMIEQADKQRYCINLVYASPIRRGKAEIIEDILPLYNIKLAVKTDKTIKNVYLGLTGEKLDFVQKDGKAEFVLPKLECHTSIVVEY